MMKKFVKMGGLMIAFLMVLGTAQAQKFGYVNSALILQEMPDVKQMNSNLEGFKTQLEKKAKQMMEDYQSQRQAAAEKEQLGQLSPIQKEELIKQLTDKEQEIVKYQQDSEQKLVEKQQELLNPILERVNTAINDVAKEDGYQFIFDGTTGIILYADETTDITAKVKTKLGI